MAAQRFVDLLNEQIGHEYAAHQQYVAIAVYYDNLTMPQMAALFYRQAIEERDHAMMMVQYLLDTDSTVAIPGVAAPTNTFADIVEPVEPGPGPGEARHRPGQRADRRRPRGARLRVRPVHAVVHQGAGRGGQAPCPTC